MPILLPALLLALVTGLAHAETPLQLNAAQIKALGIETRRLDDAANTRPGTLPARVVVPNDQMRIVSAPVGGLIEMLAVAPGSTVKRGQVLARLASPQALELQRDALQAGSQAALLQQNLKRDEQLFSEGLIAESRLQATRAAATQATAQASERRQGLALAGVAPGKLGGPLELTAPLDGVVLEQGVQLGQRVDAATAIYRVARLTPLWLEIQAPAESATGLREGMPIRIAGSPVSGKLIAIGRAVEAASQTVLLRASVGQGADTLRPGQVIEVEQPAGGSGQNTLPASAIAYFQGTSMAFVQTAHTKEGASFAARKVRILGQGGNQVAVDGLKAGEEVVVKGATGLKAMLAGVGKE
ncbi:MAG: efflux RND transporter periplasmic adaptor subunit [Rhodocyclales bacterium GT-UBC]|nr:MAG: efflux RND transporter periplasmic adaptor subunit [Rhodocyclales bacterium GT-UBC]